MFCLTRMVSGSEWGIWQCCPYRLCGRSLLCWQDQEPTFKNCTGSKRVVSVLMSARVFWKFTGFGFFWGRDGVVLVFQFHLLCQQKSVIEKSLSRIYTSGLRPIPWKPASNRLILVPPCKLHFSRFESRKVCIRSFHFTCFWMGSEGELTDRDSMCMPTAWALLPRWLSAFCFAHRRCRKQCKWNTTNTTRATGTQNK